MSEGTHLSEASFVAIARLKCVWSPSALVVQPPSASHFNGPKLNSFEGQADKKPLLSTGS